MRRLLAVVALSLSASIAAAEPLLLSHAGSLLDGSDHPVTATVSMTFRLFDAESGGIEVWSSGTCPMQVRDGRYAVLLGQQCAGSPSLATAHLPADGARWLEVSVAGATLLPRARLVPTPPAVDALKLAGLPASDYVRHAQLGAGGTAAIDAARLVSGTLDVARLPPGLASLSAAAQTFAGAVTAAGFQGNGAGLTGVDAARLEGQSLSQLDSRYAVLTGGKIAASVIPDVTTSGRMPVANGRTTCTAADTGLVYFDTTAASLRVCDGANYQAVGGQRPARLSTTPARLEFGTVAGAARELTLTIRNDGDVAATGVTVALGATVNSTFQLPSGGACGTIAAGATCLIPVSAASKGNADAGIGTLTVSSTNAASVNVAMLATNRATATSCRQLKDRDGVTTSGTYTIDPDGPGGAAAITALCDMDTAGGGWTLILRDTWDDTSVPKGITTLPAQNSAGTPSGTGDYVGPHAFLGDYLYVCKSCSGDNKFISHQGTRPDLALSDALNGSYDRPLMTLQGNVVRADQTMGNRLNVFYNAGNGSCGPVSTGRDNGANCWNNFFGSSYWENIPGGNASQVSAAGHVVELYVRER